MRQCRLIAEIQYRRLFAASESSGAQSIVGDCAKGATPYNTSTELVAIMALPPSLTHSTLESQSVDGATMGYKVYVVLTTGNEKGSNAALRRGSE